MNRQALLEFLVHGVRYVFPPVLGRETSGMPTAAGGPGLASKLPAGEAVVWPTPDGRARGVALTPLYRAATRAASGDDRLHRALALVDVLRLGQLQERRQAQGLLDAELSAEGR